MPTPNTRAKRRPSYINLSSVNNCATSDVLSPRTPRNITKSRRSSVVAEHVGEAVMAAADYSTSTNAAAARRSSLVSLNGGPPLLSDSTNYYFQDLSSQDDETIRSETPTLKARASTDDLLGGGNSNRNSYNSIASNNNRRTRSSSLSSILGSVTVLPSFDVHTLYKIKTTRSSKKLDHFFGEYAPHDICIKEIRKEGLKAILESKAPLCYFLYHLLQEYSSENLVCS